jgi:hypothetical protein
MKNKLLLAIGFSSLLSFAIAKDVQLEDKTINLTIKKGELILLNFPFEIKSDKNIELFGNKDAVEVKFKEKSVYFVTEMLPLKMLVYGDDRPIYLEFENSKSSGKEAEKIFSFKNTSETPTSKLYFELKESDKRIVEFTKDISPDGELVGNKYFKETVDKTIDIDGLSVVHQEKHKGSHLDIDKYLVSNISFTAKELREIDFFSKDNGVVANIFGNGDGHLEYGWYTWVYVFREPTMEK